MNDYKARIAKAVSMCSTNQHHALQALVVIFDKTVSDAQDASHDLDLSERRKIHEKLNKLGSEIEWAIHWIMLGDESPKVGVLRSDEDGHKYLIPKRTAARFDDLMASIDQAEGRGRSGYDFRQIADLICRLQDKLSAEFDEFRIDGIEDCDIIMPDA